MLSLINKRIGLIFAFKKEAEPILNENFSLITKEPFRIFKGMIENIEAILALSGLGKIKASACTQYLINNFDIDFFINAGSCGGVCPKYNIKDVLMATLCIEYDFKSIREGTPQIPVNDFFINIARSINLQYAVLGSADSNADSFEKKKKLHNMGIQIADWEGIAVLKTAKINKKEAVIIKVITDSSTTNFEEEFIKNLSECSIKLSYVIKKFIHECYKDL